jgi:hypothetical protein
METRRSFLRKGVYVAPIVLSVAVRPAFAQRPYSVGKKEKEKGNNGVGNGLDPQPPGNPPVNDGAGTSPGNPGNKKGKGKGN